MPQCIPFCLLRTSTVLKRVPSIIRPSRPLSLARSRCCPLPRTSPLLRSITTSVVKQSERVSQRESIEIVSDQDSSSTFPYPSSGPTSVESSTTVRRVVRFWQNGFSVDDGPLYRYDDPTTKAMLEAINQGRVLRSVMNVLPEHQKVDIEFDDTNQNIPFGLLGSQTGAPAPGHRISLRPLYFALGICVGSFFVADVLGRMKDAQFLRVLKRTGWTSGDGQAAKMLVESAEKQQTLAWLQRLGAPGLAREIYGAGKDWWARQNDGQRAVVIIIALNTLPFLAWRLPAVQIQRFMSRSFSEYPGVNSSYTMLTSVFSHESFMHFAFNMIALYSFGAPAFNYLKQQRIFGFPNIDDRGSMNIDTTYHNIAFFASCGVLANLAPHYITLLSSRSPALMRTSAAPALIPRPSLGASGAVYSCLAVCAMAYPKMSVSLIFLPMVPIPIGWGFPALAAVDAFGVLRGWHRFGHLTHLTGAAAGVGAYHYGAGVWYWGQSILRGGQIRGESSR